MALEVRQMVVKSTITQGRTGEPPGRDSERRLEALKEEVLEECRRWIRALRDDPRER